jgi:hypothetical protein
MSWLKRASYECDKPMEKTKSEAMFERFLSTNGIPFRRVPTGPMKTPDYEVTIARVELIFEVKNWLTTQTSKTGRGRLARGLPPLRLPASPTATVPQPDCTAVCFKQ